GSFGKLDIQALKIPQASYLWQEASLLFDISDVRGIEDELIMQFGRQSLRLEPGRFVTDQFKSALGSAVQIDPSDSLTKEFNLEFSLRGSGQMLFVPAGKTTTVQMQSSWPNPSFTGNYLPGTRNVSEKGFDATWKVLYLNRNFPQQWTGVSGKINESAFGTDLLQPVDVYQKSTRSVKYALLCIVLTFTAFLLIELVYSRSLHPFHYVLVGFALCIFYTLLLSVSEYLDFNLAYLLATVATVTMVAVFVRSVLGSSRIAGFVALILTMMYGFIFILIQSQDYALLMGSIGLFLTLALVMYFSRKAKLT
ncbi:MAG TPA: cell envelope integrity protein CreD, partial [Sphingobacteriaceae bacterium]